MYELNISKYEPPVKQIQLAGGKKIKYKDNPNFQVYYKFPNQNNTPNMFNENSDVVITRKLHGTNSRYGIVKKSKLSFKTLSLIPSKEETHLKILLDKNDFYIK
jgi:hypothetical protein